MGTLAEPRFLLNVGGLFLLGAILIRAIHALHATDSARRRSDWVKYS
jgi:hypothetical protein